GAHRAARDGAGAPAPPARRARALHQVAVDHRQQGRPREEPRSRGTDAHRAGRDSRQARGGHDPGPRRRGEARDRVPPAVALTGRGRGAGRVREDGPRDSFADGRRRPPRDRGRRDGDGPRRAHRRASRSRPSRPAALTGEETMRYRRISADCHIDFPWLPADLFTANASSAMKDRMPYVVEGPDGPYWTTKKGAGLGLVGGLGSSGQKYVPGQNQRVDVMASTGLFADGRKGIRRPADPELRIADMERDGVDAEVMFGILGAATRLADHEAAPEMFRIYNDWLVDFCGHHPDRQVGLACLPYGDIEAAVAEAHRVAKRGLRGLELSCSWEMEPMWHPMWEPLWRA